MSTTLEDSTAAIRSAVSARMAATPADDPKMVGYVSPAVTEPLPQVAAAEDLQHDEWDDCKDGPYVRHLLEQHRLRGDGLTQSPVTNGSAEWLDALERLRALHFEKTAQYGGAEDAFENVTASAKCGVEPWRRALCDLSDCVVRMQKYAQGQPVDPTNALLDAANWALICLIKMEQADQ